MDSDAWSALLYTWAPILLLIGFWLFFMRKFKKQTTYTERSLVGAPPGK
jgi:ATP-dependent Zn protease